jgi:hypothetical protein
MRRVLIVAYYFPPIGGIGAIRAARFAELLPDFGWEPTVLAPASTPHPTDPDLRYPAERVIRSPSLELSRLGRMVGSSVGAASSNPASDAPSGRGGGQERRSAAATVRSALRLAAHRYVFYPDAQIGWYPGATIRGLRALARTRFDLVYSSSNPITAHLVARTLGRRAGLPWVAEFRDPWSDRLAPDHPYREHGQRLAANLGRGASAVIMPTPTMGEWYSRIWDRQITIVENGHDLGHPQPRPPDRLTLTHLGTYYPGKQSFRAVWAALAELVRMGTGRPPVVQFVGELPAEVMDEASQYGVGDLIRATGIVPHHEAIEAVLSSSILMASGFAGSHPLDLGVIPAKLFEYLASLLPVLYLTDTPDDASGVLRGQPGCFVLNRDDTEGILALLRDGVAGRVYEREVEPLSRRARTRELAAVFDRAVG